MIQIAILLLAQTNTAAVLGIVIQLKHLSRVSNFVLTRRAVMALPSAATKTVDVSYATAWF